MEPVNEVRLEGEVLPGREERWTPAGIPLTRLELEHRSRVRVAGLERVTQCRVTVACLGQELADAARAIPDGGWCRVAGFLGQRIRNRPGQEPYYGRLELHARELESVAQPGEPGSPPDSTANISSESGE
jgi:primosomal replication protein N